MPALSKVCLSIIPWPVGGAGGVCPDKSRDNRAVFVVWTVKNLLRSEFTAELGKLLLPAKSEPDSIFVKAGKLKDDKELSYNIKELAVESTGNEMDCKLLLLIIVNPLTIP